MSKTKTLFLSFIPFLAAIGVQLAAAMLVSFSFSFIAGLQLGLQGVTDMEALTNTLTELLSSSFYTDLVTLITMILLVIVFSIWYFKTKPGRYFAQLQDSFAIRNVLILIVSAVALQIAVSMLLNLILPFFPNTMNKYMDLMNTLVGGNLVISILTTVILAPLAEEFIFRGLVLQKLQKAFPFIIANIIQALLFGIYHMNLVQGIYAFLLGLVFGFVAYRLKSIWASVLLHALVNGASFLLDYLLPESILELPFAMILLSTVCFVVVILLCFLFRVPNAPLQETTAWQEEYQKGLEYGKNLSSPYFTGQRYDNLSQYPVSQSGNYYPDSTTQPEALNSTGQAAPVQLDNTDSSGQTVPVLQDNTDSSGQTAPGDNSANDTDNK